MNKALVVIVILLIFIVGGLTLSVLFLNKSKNIYQNENKLIPVNTILHSHGLATDVIDPNKLYIATHHGLYLLENDKNLFQIGASKDDYMGFSVHPKNPKIFYTSGHPETGGNLGFQKSEDGGFTWKHISNVESIPVDFHAMTISPVNPNLIYGWYQGKFYRTENGGKDWNSNTANFVVTSIVGDPKNENTVYGLTPQGQGVLISENKGESWDNLSEDLLGGIVSSLAIDPQDPNQMLAFSEKLGGLGHSNDGGKAWKLMNEDFNGEEVLFMAYSKPKSGYVYALTHTNSIYKSADSGVSWKKIK